MSIQHLPDVRNGGKLLLDDQTASNLPTEHWWVDRNDIEKATDSTCGIMAYRPWNDVARAGAALDSAGLVVS